MKSFVKLIFISVCLMISACAHITTTIAPNDEEALKQKVQTEWDAKVNRDWGAVYDMTTDAYKKTVDKNTFIRKANIQIENFSIKDVKILTSGKEAKSVVEYTINQMGFKFNTTANEKWLWEAGDWHLDIPPSPVKALFGR